MDLKKALERRAAKKRLATAVDRYNQAVDEDAAGWGLGLVASEVKFTQQVCERLGVSADEIADIKAAMR
jgi:hypothetical protein